MAGGTLWGSLIEHAAAGDVRLDVDPQAFVDLNNACTEFVSGLGAVIDHLAALDGTYGLGEANGEFLAAVGLAAHFRQKVAGGDNDATTVLAGCRDVAERIRDTLLTILTGYSKTDAEFGRALVQIERAGTGAS